MARKSDDGREPAVSGAVGSDSARETREAAAADEAPALAIGPDGAPRCWWSVGTPEYVAYHDEEWGRPVVDDHLLFEHLCLEVFQAGLSWLTVLRRREALRRAFAGFDAATMAEFDDRDVARLLDDATIIRNRAKIEAVIANARCCLEVAAGHGSLAGLMWSYAPAAAGAGRRARTDIPATSPESAAMSADLKRRGFRFVGPTTLYAHMQACGMVNDHVEGCRCRSEAASARERQAPAIEALVQASLRSGQHDREGD